MVEGRKVICHAPNCFGEIEQAQTVIYRFSSRRKVTAHWCKTCGCLHLLRGVRPASMIHDIHGARAYLGSDRTQIVHRPY